MGGGASKQAETVEAERAASTVASTAVTASSPVSKEAAGAAAAAASVVSVDESEDEGVYDGFLVETNIKFDLSVPTSAVEGALAVVKVVAKLIQAFVNRNKFMRAMQTRIEAIEAAVTSLKQRSPGTLQSALPALNSLVRVLVDYKKFVKYVTKKPDNFFDKFTSFFRAKSDLENLAEFDTLFSRVLADLNIPLQADQIRMMEEQRNNLTQLSADIAKVLAKIDESKVLAISKKCLTYEESLTFWMDCFPDKFQVPVRDFVVTLKVWFEECRGMQVNKRNIENIVTAINLGELASAVPDDDEDAGDGALEVDGPDEFIDAREANLLFGALPENYKTMKFSDVTKKVVEYVKARRAKELRDLQEARQRAARRLANSADEVSSAEKTLLANLGEKTFAVRFVCELSTLVSGRLERREDMRCSYVAENGCFYVLGTDRVTGVESIWSGRLYDDLTLELSVPDDAGDPSSTLAASGQFRGNAFVAHCCQRSALAVYYLRLPSLFRWEGYWELPTGSRGDMFLFLGDNNGAVDGISDDEAGVAIWRGSITDTEFVVTKKYLNRHFVEYKGAVLRKADGLRYVKGEWQIPGDWSGTFELWEQARD